MTRSGRRKQSMALTQAQVLRRIGEAQAPPCQSRSSARVKPTGTWEEISTSEPGGMKSRYLLETAADAPRRPLHPTH